MGCNFYVHEGVGRNRKGHDRYLKIMKRPRWTYLVGLVVGLRFEAGSFELTLVFAETRHLTAAWVRDDLES